MGDQLLTAIDQKQRTHRCQAVWNCWNYAFRPTDTIRVGWDVFMLVLVIYSCFALPYKTAFVLEETLRLDPSHLGMDPLDWVVDAVFYLDLVLNFWTGYLSGHMIVTDKTRIAKHYLAGRFSVDLLATGEWDLLARLLICGSGGCTGSLRSLNDITALFRMLKVLRLARAGPLISRLSSSSTMHSAYITAFEFFLYVVVCAHVLACLFYMIPILFECEQDPPVNGTVFFNGEALTNNDYSCMSTSWRTNYGLNDASNARLMGPMDQYISAFYWSMTTMTTIGYGDRGPGNSPEIVFTLAAEVLGLSFFALLLLQITTVYEELHAEKSKQDDIKDTIVQFMRCHLPANAKADRVRQAGLIGRVVDFLHFKTTTQSSKMSFDPDGPFGKLSPALQREVREEAFIPILLEVKLFGHSRADDKDVAQVYKLFDAIDVDSSGTLDTEEVRNLIVELGLDLVPADFEEAITVMDAFGGNLAVGNDAVPGSPGYGGVRHISRIAFAQWWYKQKHRRPRVSKCPIDILKQLTRHMESICVCPSECIVEPGQLGEDFYILIQGSVEFKQANPDYHPEEGVGSDIKLIGLLDGEGHPRHPQENRINSELKGETKDRVFGLTAILEQQEYEVACREGQHVAVVACDDEDDHCECIKISRQDLLASFIDWRLVDSPDRELDTGLKFWREAARFMHHNRFEAGTEWNGRMPQLVAAEGLEAWDGDGDGESSSTGAGLEKLTARVGAMERNLEGKLDHLTERVGAMSDMEGKLDGLEALLQRVDRQLTQGAAASDLA